MNTSKTISYILPGIEGLCKHSTTNMEYDGELSYMKTRKSEHWT